MKKSLKQSAKKINIPYYFTDKALPIEFTVNLDSHHIKHTNFQKTFKSSYSQIGIETRYVYEILKRWLKFLLG